MKSWKSAVKTVVPATAASTWSSPNTSRRTRIPRSWAELLTCRYSVRSLDSGGRAPPASRLRLLYVREVGGVRDHLEAGTGDGVADELAVLGRGRWIFGAGDHERRRRYRGEPIAQVHVPDGLAASSVALGVSLAQHRPGPLEGLRAARLKLRGEPAFLDGVGDSPDALGPNRLGPRLPRLG